MTTADKRERVIDLTECEREPICHLGLIQPHGRLIAVDSLSKISHVSANISQQFKVSPPEVLGLPLARVLGPAAHRIIADVFSSLSSGITHYQEWQGLDEKYSLWTHKTDARYILEWEQLPSNQNEQDATALACLDTGLADIRANQLIYENAQRAAELTRRVTGYHRVMIYQFHPDWSGEVIAEVRQARAEPFLGLRYPASDIPPQARKLYTETRLRVLVNTYSAPIHLLSLPTDTAPLDLTHSQLRSMSPYHVEYLKNLKVGATATASLLVDGKLWGLIACHHDERKLITPLQRSAISKIAEVLSNVIRHHAFRQAQLSSHRVEVRKQTLDKTLSESDASTALSAILFGPDRLRKMIHCCGTAFWSAGAVVRLGDTLSAQELALYARQLLHGDRDLVAFDSRADMTARFGFAPENSSLAGLIALVVSRDTPLILFGTRQEVVREIVWGGDINEPVLRNEQTGALSPRRSFAQYKQSITGKSVPWSEEDLATSGIVLKALQQLANSPQQTSWLIQSGVARLRDLATGTFTLQDTLLDSIGSGISLLFRSDSEDLTLRYANQTLLELADTCSNSVANYPDLGTLLEAIGLPLDLLTKCDVAPHQIAMQTPYEGLRHYLVERKLALEISDPDGTVSLSALLFTDITRAERAREALKSAEERARHLALLKSSFLANMSHEIRTPMNGILGMVQLLQTTSTDDEQKRYIEIIKRSGDIMLKVINDILDLSKMEAGHVQLEEAPFDLTQLIEGVVDMLRPRALEKSVRISAVFDATDPLWLLGDAFRLRQVLLNIAGNAVKFTSKGEVQIRVHDDPHTRHAQLLMISVSDTGIGIPEDQLSQVFEKFHQADPSTTRKHGGTGLGLSISKELVSLMGGTIGLVSTVRVGSTFTISLPLVKANPPNASHAPALQTTRSHFAPGAGRRILVAEDDSTNQVVIETILKSKGFEVEIASSGQRVLDLLDDHGCDLILMDCQMPGLDGYQTTARIRAIEGVHRHTPIIALTAHALPEDRQRCLNAGMDDYLAKPIDILALWQALRKWNCLSALPVE